MPVTRPLSRPHTAATPSRHAFTSSTHNMKGRLRCIFSRSANITSRPTTPLVLLQHGRGGRSRSAGSQAHHIEYSKVQKAAKKKKNTQLGHDEETRIMRILHNLQTVERTKTPALLRDELTQLYIEPLPEYIQDKLKQHEERDMPRSAILFEELFENHSLEDNEITTSADKIQLPEQKPQVTSRWQQKMLTKLEKMESNSTHNSNSNSTVIQKPPLNAPHLNRQLQVQGQGSSAASKLYSTRYNKPPIPSSASSPPLLPTPPPHKPKQSSFPYTDPLPHPTSYLSNKEGLSPFEERVLELEKLERDSILIERTNKPRVSNKEVTTRIPSTLMQQPKYLDSTLAFQSRVAQRKPVSGNNGGKNGRSLTPTSVTGKFSDSKRKTIREKETILQQKRKSSNNKISLAAKS